MKIKKEYKIENNKLMLQLLIINKIFQTINKHKE